MPSRRYTIVIADRSSGLVRRVTVSVRAISVLAVGIVGLPILIGLGAKWSGTQEVAQLESSNAALMIENSNNPRLAVGDGVAAWFRVDAG